MFNCLTNSSRLPANGEADWVDKVECLAAATVLTIGAVALFRSKVGKLLPSLEVNGLESFEKSSTLSALDKSVTVVSPVTTISHYLNHAGDFAQGMKLAFEKPGEITSNIADALNDFSRQRLPYAEGVVVHNLGEHPSLIADAGDGHIRFYGDFEMLSDGGASLHVGQTKFAKADLAAVSAHEYVHVEQRALKNRFNGGEMLSADESTRLNELIRSHNKSASVESYLDKANATAETSTLYFSRVARLAVDQKRIDFLSFYNEVSRSRTLMPSTMANLVQTQFERRELVEPHPSNFEMGKTLYQVMRAATLSAQSKARMGHELYEQLYHEREASVFAEAVRQAY